MARKALIIGQATDYAGVTWDVRESRITHHGFDVLVGWPRSTTRGQGGGGPRVITTVELARYLATTRLCDVDLPISGTTVKRARAALGVRWSWDEWWDQRAGDLQSMTLEAFCARHGCSMGAASQRRRYMRASDHDAE